MLVGFSIGLPAFAVFLYCVRAFHARRNTRTPFYLNLGENALNVALVLPFIALLGPRGLSAAYSAAYWVAAGAALVVLHRRVPGLLGWSLLAQVGRSALVGAAVLVWVAVALMYLDSTGAVAEVLTALAVAVPVFLAATALVRPHGFEPLLDRLAAGVRRRTGRD